MGRPPTKAQAVRAVQRAGFVPLRDEPARREVPEDRRGTASTERSEGDGVPDGIRTRVLALKGPRPDLWTTGTRVVRT